MSKEKPTHKFPSGKELLLGPLYQSYKIEESKDWDKLWLLKNFSSHIDIFCPECNKEATFKSPKKAKESWEMKSEEKAEEVQNSFPFFVVELNCTRHQAHRFTCFFGLERDINFDSPEWDWEYKITKIGQFPSLADIHLGTASKYKKELDKHYRDLVRGVGLRAHGIGIGAFVYLRRIFENLIEDAYKTAVKTGSLNEANYKSLRMDEKIALLKEYLPEILVKNKGIYKILSKGIHELSEEECLSYFDVVRNGIELILDERLEKIEKENKIKKINLAIEKLSA